MHERIRCKISKMVADAEFDSETVRMNTMFESKEALHNHFERMFEPGMSWDNYGLADGTWQIGHRIARSMYDKTDSEDVKRCWNPCNLFPQWSRENRQEGVTLPPDAELAKLSAIFPTGWLGVCPDTTRRQELQQAAANGRW